MNYGSRNYGGQPPEPSPQTSGIDTVKELVGCLVGLPLAFAVMIGLPIVIVHGLTSGDWGWFIPWGIGAAITLVLGRLDMITVIND